MPSKQNASYIGHYSTVPEEAIPGLYNGMRVEVLTPENELLFVADAQVLSEQMIELVRTSELQEVSPAEERPVGVRGFNAYENRSVYLSGTLSKLAQSQDSAWLVKNIDRTVKAAGRSFSRRPIRAKAWVRPLSEPGAEWIEGEVVNASVGGVCFRVAERFEKGTKLSVRFRLRPGKEQPPLNIAVRRVTERDRQTMEYGCEFVDVDEAIDTIITKTIIELQIMQ